MDRVGLVVIVAVLVLGTAVGLSRRRTQGRFRDVPPATRARAGTDTPPTAGRGPAAAGPAERPVEGPATGVVPDEVEEPGVIETAAEDAGSEMLFLAALGVEAGSVTLLQFSSAFCAPCRAVRRVSAEVTAMLPAVRHVEVDAESHLDAVRALGVWRTPTLLVLDADGRVVKRATGVPTKPQLIAVLADLLPPSP